MDNLIYSLNATVPVFVVIVAGYIFKKIGWINDGFIKASNKLTFTVTLPLLLIQDMMNNDFLKKFDLTYVLFCFFVTLLCCIGTTIVTKIVMKDKSIIAEFVQASYRSSAAVLGAAFILNIYGDAGMLPLMIIGAVPLYNVYAVIILTVECPEKGAKQEKTLAKTLKGIATNPIILGIVIGAVVAIVRASYDKNYSEMKGGLGKILLAIFNIISKIYLTVVRGTPVVIQIMIMYYIIFATSNNKIFVAILSFGINSGAYVAEIFRGGIMSIDEGQFEAGRSLGFNYVQTMVYVIIPQAFKTVLPTLGNEFIVLLKETAVSGYVALIDLTRAGDIVRGATYQAFMPLFGVAAVYLIMVMFFSWLLGKLERRLRNDER